MILDAGKMTEDERTEFREGRRRIYVNDVEAHKVCYLDTDEGFLKTFDGFHQGAGGPAAWAVNKGDGRYWTAEDFPGREVSANRDSVLIETLRGKVEIRET